MVEDHKLSQKVIRGMLNKLGLDPELAANGKEALEKACQRRYDLILMDCEMPEMDGFEATRRIREHERRHGLAPVPIVALTAHILREHRERSLASGMNAHIPKPVEMSVLRDTLVRFTSGSGGGATPPETSPPATKGATEGAGLGEPQQQGDFGEAQGRVAQVDVRQAAAQPVEHLLVGLTLTAQPVLQGARRQAQVAATPSMDGSRRSAAGTARPGPD